MHISNTEDQIAVKIGRGGGEMVMTKTAVVRKHTKDLLLPKHFELHTVSRVMKIAERKGCLHFLDE